MSTAEEDLSGSGTDGKRRIAGICWKKGTEAMSKENWDYCIEMFGQCVTLVPDNLMYRQTLRNCEFRKYKNNKTGASMSGMRLMGTRGKVKKARTSKAWSEMDAACEEGLAVNPWDPQLNADLGEAARNLGHDDIAIFAYTLAVAGDPKNVDFLRGCAEVLRAKGEYDRARECWKKIYELNPLDGHARQMMTDSDTQKLIDRSGMDGSKTTHQISKGYEASVKGNAANANEVVAPGVSAEVDLKHAIRKDPNNKDNYQKLGDLYRRENKLQQAMEAYQKAFEISNDFVVREQAEEVKLDMLRRNLEQAKEAAAKSADDAQLRETVVTLSKDLLAEEIEIFTRWSDRRPQDLKLKYELAQRLIRDNKLPQATKLLQQASADVRMEGPVRISLGKCFLKQKQNALALRQFEKAAERLTVSDHPEQYAEVNYLLGRLYEEAKDLDKAEVHYTEVIGVDYEYRDARQRLETIQAARGASGLADIGDV